MAHVEVAVDLHNKCIYYFNCTLIANLQLNRIQKLIKIGKTSFLNHIIQIGLYLVVVSRLVSEKMGRPDGTSIWVDVGPVKESVVVVLLSQLGEGVVKG